MDRVLSTRIDAMAYGLDRLKKVSEDVSAARRGLDDLGRQVYELGATLKTIGSLTNDLRGALETMSDNMELFETTHNQNFIVSNTELRTQLDRARELEAEVKILRNSVSVEASNSISRLRRWSALSRSKVFKLDVDEDAARKLENSLKQAATEEKPWSYFRSQVQESCDDLLSQYVDLVGGIALRDQGLDQVTSHADVLVALLLASFGAENAIAVPSRHTGQPLVQARHVRMPLPPGWTLWSLPLVARGVGELLRATKLPTISLGELLPDVFGAYVLGPSYAFAALLLEFDPWDVLDRRRAGVVFHVLRQTDSEDDGRRFTMLVDEISREWTTAVAAAAGNSPVTVDAPADLDKLLTEVSVRCDNAAYLARDRWDAVETLSADLASGANITTVNGDLRDVLSAMWLARWRHPEKFKSIEQGSTKAAEQVTAGEGRFRESQNRQAPTENRI